MLAISYSSHIRLWGIAEDGSKNDIGELLYNVFDVADLLCENLLCYISYMSTEYCIYVAPPV